MLAEFGVWDEDWEAFDAGYAFSPGAHLDDVYFVGSAYFDWAFASAAFVLGVSGGSFSWADRQLSPLSLYNTLTHIINVFHSLSLTQQTACSLQLDSTIDENFKLAL
jgi:hypothetical protein